jgi:hypothetical protein
MTENLHSPWLGISRLPPERATPPPRRGLPHRASRLLPTQLITIQEAVLGDLIDEIVPFSWYEGS